MFPGPAIPLVNKIKHAKKEFVSQNIINFANNNSTDRPTPISKK